MSPLKTPDTAAAAVAWLARDRGRLVRRAIRRGVPLADAEDVVQTGLLRALSHAGQLRDGARADAWVSRVVQNAAIDHVRACRTPAASQDVDALASAGDDGIDCWCVLTQMQGLGVTHREILQLVVIEGCSLDAAASRLGITANAASVRLHRARAALRAQLSTHCGTTNARSCNDCGCAERGCCPPP